MGRKILLFLFVTLSGLAWTGAGFGQTKNSTVERRILASTLRIEIETWIVYIEGQGYTSMFGDGHGTVMDGRYLVTHNHFRFPLQEMLKDKHESEFATITLFQADGRQIWQGPLKVTNLAFPDSETLVLEFEGESGVGLFETLDVPSADFAALPPVKAGMEVAQVNWDGNQAYIQWTTVEAVGRRGDTPVMKLADCLIPGSSGGGVFVNGVHVANNWSRSLGCDEATSNEAQDYSVAALNSAELLLGLMAE